MMEGRVPKRMTQFAPRIEFSIAKWKRKPLKR
jgi:hypothetical protein